ncbi:MAG: TetR/AcrR family transcriptional regulator [Burkholderiales bacterium]|nr:TetR/AcrR family transcriptional regulator [Burkholderiales bacterium]
MKTRDRIVQESLLLFNKHGERPITTNHIAAHLGISPGNLYYHFRNKEEIIYQIFRQYQDYMREHFSIPDTRELAPEDLTRYLEAAFAAMWQYRFLFYDLPGLLARNSPLSEDYHAFVRSELAPLLARAFGKFAEIGFLSVKPVDILPLATNAWLIAKFWFPFWQSIRPDVPVTEETSKLGIRQVLSLLKPYVQPDYTERFAVMEARYPLPMHAI